MTEFTVTTTVADNLSAIEIREYTLDTLPVLLKPLAYILTDREFISLEFTMGLAHFRIEPTDGDLYANDDILRGDGYRRILESGDTLTDDEGIEFKLASLVCLQCNSNQDVGFSPSYPGIICKVCAESQGT